MFSYGNVERFLIFILLLSRNYVKPFQPLSPTNKQGKVSSWLGNQDVDTDNSIQSSWTPKMIVFDKDGTLGDCTQSMHIWSKRMTNVILDECQKTDLSAEQMDQLIRNFHTAIGWDPLHEALLPSSYLSSGTWGQILHATTLVLDEGNIPDAKEKVQFWHDNLGDIHANDKPLIDDLPGFMSILRQQYEGVLIAICTSDDRSATNSCIKNWKLQDYIDFSICGDEVMEGKPSVEPIMTLCERAQVTPQDCIVVGDTTADTIMGTRAKVGLTIGVLTGTGTTDLLLENGADIILRSIEDMIQPTGLESMSNTRKSSSDLTETSSLSSEGDLSL